MLKNTIFSNDNQIYDYILFSKITCGDNLEVIRESCFAVLTPSNIKAAFIIHGNIIINCKWKNSRFFKNSFTWNRVEIIHITCSFKISVMVSNSLDKNKKPLPIGRSLNNTLKTEQKGKAKEKQWTIKHGQALDQLVLPSWMPHGTYTCSLSTS